MKHQNIIDVLSKYINGELPNSEMLEIKNLIQTNEMYKDAYVGLKKILKKSSTENVKRISKFIQEQKQTLLNNSSHSNETNTPEYNNSDMDCLIKRIGDLINKEDKKTYKSLNVEICWEMFVNVQEHDLAPGTIIFFSTSEIKRLSKLKSNDMRNYSSMLGIGGISHTENLHIFRDDSNNLRSTILNNILPNRLLNCEGEKEKQSYNRQKSEERKEVKLLIKNSI